MTSRTMDRLARIAELEAERSRIAAEQAREVAALAAERRAVIEAEIAAGPVPGIGSRRRREHAERQLKADVAHARRISPWEAGRFLTWACEAESATPAVFALLAAGAVSEKRVRTVAEVTAPLTPEQRRVVDADIAARMLTWGDRKVDTETRAAVYRVDPAGAVERNAYAQNERRVSFRPAPETMGWLTALLPMVQLVACRAALDKAVAMNGDDRERGQVMADTLVERLTGQASASDVPIDVQLVITDQTLLGGDTPARFSDGTPIPAPAARDLVLNFGDTDTARRVRRLFADPAGRLVTAETHSRQFTKAMAELIKLRDHGTCTTDYCDAPIRHTDHLDPASHGGPTSLTNGQGTCVWCNETKADTVPARPPDRPPNRPHHRRRIRSRVEHRLRRTLRDIEARRTTVLVDIPPTPLH